MASIVLIFERGCDFDVYALWPEIHVDELNWLNFHFQNVSLVTTA